MVVNSSILAGLALIVLGLMIIGFLLLGVMDREKARAKREKECLNSQVQILRAALRDSQLEARRLRQIVESSNKVVWLWRAR